MTNEEAIEQIKWYFEEDDGSGAEPITKEAVSLAITAIKDLEVCRNELCLRCGQYKQRHLGACDGCRWYTPTDDYNQSQIQCHGC